MPTKAMMEDARQRMHASVEAVQRDLTAMRTGRASLAMIDGIRIDYYGTLTPLNQVGNLSIPDATLMIPMHYSEGMMMGGPMSLYGPFTTGAYGHLGFMNILGWADPRRDIS